MPQVTQPSKVVVCQPSTEQKTKKTLFAGDWEDERINLTGVPWDVCVCVCLVQELGFELMVDGGLIHFLLSWRVQRLYTIKCSTTFEKSHLIAIR